MITAIDLIHKKFSRSIYGYKPSEVDDLLREMSRELETAARDRARYEEQIDQLQSQLNRYKEMEDTLNNSILLAQRTADEVKAAAHRESDIIRREAEQLAREHAEQSLRERGELLSEIRILQERRNYLIESLKNSARELSDWVNSRVKNNEIVAVSSDSAIVSAPQIAEMTVLESASDQSRSESEEYTEASGQAV